MFRLASVVTVMTLACGLFATTATAQDRQKIGVVFAVPATVGFDWEISPRVAVRPDVAFERQTSPRTSSPQSTSYDYKRLSVGVSAVVYVRTAAPLRLYVSPRFNHQLGRSAAVFTHTQSEWSGSFGAQYELAPRFAIFAEAGVGYARWRDTAGGTTSIVTATALATRSSLGAILFF